MMRALLEGLDFPEGGRLFMLADFVFIVLPKLTESGREVKFNPLLRGRASLLTSCNVSLQQAIAR